MKLVCYHSDGCCGILCVFTSLIYICFCVMSCSVLRSGDCPPVYADTYFRGFLRSELEFAYSKIEEARQRGDKLLSWGEYNRDGHRDGLWFFLYDDGMTIESIGYYNDGHKDSVWLYFRMDGSLWIVMHHLGKWGGQGQCFLHRYEFRRNGLDRDYGLCNPEGKIVAWVRFEGQHVYKHVNLNAALMIVLVNKGRGDVIRLGDTILAVVGSRLDMLIYPVRPRCFLVRSYIQLEGYTEWVELGLPDNIYQPVRYSVRFDSEGEFRMLYMSKVESEYYSFSYESDTSDRLRVIVFADRDSMYSFYGRWLHRKQRVNWY